MPPKPPRRPWLEVLEGRVLLNATPLAVAASISGAVYEDSDGDGGRDAGEDGLIGRTVFLDADRDGALDAAEPLTTTGADGEYAFTDLEPGRYTVAELLPEGWVDTGLPPGRGGAADDADRLIGLDLLRDDPRFAGLDGGGLGVVVIDTGIDNDHPAFGPDADRNGKGDALAYEQDFPGNDAVAEDESGHGTHVASVIASRDDEQPGVAPGARLIALKALDAEGNGDFRHIEKALQWALNNAERYDIAAVNLSVGDGGSYDAAQALHGIDDELARLEAAGVVVVAAAGNDAAREGGTPGIAYPAASEHALAVGAVWAADVGAANWDGGARDLTTAPDRIVSFSQRAAGRAVLFAPGALVAGAGLGGGTSTESGTSVATGVVSGVVALAQQLAREHLGRPLAVAELRELMARTGAVIRDGDDEQDNTAHTGAEFRRVDAYALAEAIWDMKGPPQGEGSARGGRRTVRLAAGQSAEIDFPNFQYGRVSGVVFADRDADGQRDAGEAGVAGRTVYLDANGNAQLDAGERQVRTGATGAYEFGLLLPGTVEVRQVLPAGQRQTTPAARVAVTSGLDHVADLGTAAANQAPELSGNGSLTAVRVSDPQPAGNTVREVLGATFKDADAGARPGLAVTGGAGVGRWQFSLDGGRSWSDIGPVSPSRVRLLSDQAKVRFLPARGWSGTAVLHYRGWDGSQGRQGGWYDVGPNDLGGSGAFSREPRSASANVGVVLPPPRGPWRSIAQVLDEAGQSAGARGIAVESAHGPGRWMYSPDGWTWRQLTVPAGRVVLLPATYRLRVEPEAGAVGFPMVTYRVWRSGGWSEMVTGVPRAGIGEEVFGFES